ncbi:MAG: nitroreductase family protein [Candidatus Marinimicrobia bacterium]|nr:nitroreductase family protein [Candidatus Neomarinimicrobiota bacterium]
MIDILRKRRSIRQYKDAKIEETKVQILKEAALRAPSSRGRNPWRFLFVDNSELIEKLASSKKHGSNFLAAAPLAVVVCGDKDASDVWIEDCSIASIILQLTAQSLDLGSCWIQIRNRMHDQTTSSGDYIKNILNIPDKFRIESIIGIGYPDEKKEGIPNEELQSEKVFDNYFE